MLHVNCYVLIVKEEENVNTNEIFLLFLGNQLQTSERDQTYCIAELLSRNVRSPIHKFILKNVFFMYLHLGFLRFTVLNDASDL